jgi:hypothetical protein
VAAEFAGPRFRGNYVVVLIVRVLQVVAGGAQGLQHDGSAFGGEDGAEHVVQVFDAVPGQLTHRPGLAAVRFGDPPVRLGEPLHLVGCHRCRHLKEIVFGLRGGAAMPVS